MILNPFHMLRIILCCLCMDPSPAPPSPPPKKNQCDSFNILFLCYPFTFYMWNLLMLISTTLWSKFILVSRLGWMSTFMSNHLSEQTKKAYLHITNTEILSLCTINMTNFFPVHVKCIVIHTANCEFSHITYCIYS